MAFDEPMLSEALANDDRSLVFEILLALFTRAIRPTVAVVEDVHWADGATLDLLSALGRRIQGTHSLLIMTFRERITAGHPLSLTLGDLPSDMGLYLQTIPQLLVEAAESIQGDGFTAEAWNVMVDPSQGGTFPCFLGSCVSVLVSEIGGVFVFGSDAAARVGQFDGKGEGVYGYLQSRLESFDDTVAIAEMLFANLIFGSP